MPLSPASLKRLMELKVKDVMNPRPPTCKPETHVSELLKKFRTRKEDYVLVVNQNKKLLGIVTESDVLYALKRPSRHMFIGAWAAREMIKITASRAEEIMSKHPLTVHPENTVREALDIMSTHKFRHLPVTKEDKIVGAISIRDIIESMLKLKE